MSKVESMKLFASKFDRSELECRIQLFYPDFAASFDPLLFATNEHLETKDLMRIKLKFRKELSKHFGI